MPDSDNTTPETRLEPAGMILSWISLGLITLGVVQFSGVIILLGICGGLLLLFARKMSRSQLDDLVLERELPKRSFPAEPIAIEVAIRNEKRSLTSGHLEISEPAVKPAMRPGYLVACPAGESVRSVYEFRLFRRGLHRSDRVRITSRWPFGLFESTIEQDFGEHSRRHETIVVPRPTLPRFLLRILHQLQKEAVLHSPHVPEHFSEFRALREFRAGDPVKAIHWPTSTRTGSIIVRESDPPIPRPNRYGLVVHQDTSPGEILQPERFEAILRIAAGLIVHFQRHSIPVSFAATFTESAHTFDTPQNIGYLQLLDLLGLAESEPVRTLENLGENGFDFTSCEQVFVLGAAPIESWQDTARTVFPQGICVNLDRASRKRHKRKLKLPGKEIA